MERTANLSSEFYGTYVFKYYINRYYPPREQMVPGLSLRIEGTGTYDIEDEWELVNHMRFLRCGA